MKSLNNESFYENEYCNISDLVLFALDEKYNYITFNDNHFSTMEKIWNVKIEIGKNMLDFIKIQQDKIKAKDNFDRALKGEIFTLVEEYGDIDFSRNYYENTYKPLFDDKNKIIGLSVYVKDISVLKNIEQKLKKQNEELQATTKSLQESKANYRKLSDLTFEGVLLHDNGIAVDVNLSLEKMFGYSRKELLGKNIFDLVVPKKHHKIISKSITKNYVLPFEIEGIKKDGSILPLEIEAREIKFGNNKEIRVTAVRDITERIKAKESLVIAYGAIKDSEESLYKILKTANEGFWMINLKNETLEVNPKMCAILGYSENEMVGKSIFDFVDAKNAKIIENKNEERISKLSKSYEIDLQHKNGKTIYCLIKSSPLLNKENKRIGSFAMVTDISNLKDSYFALEIKNKKQKLLSDELSEKNRLFQESEQKFREIFEKSGDAILIIENGIFTDCNQAAVDMIKYKSKEDFLSSHPSKLSPELQPDGLDSKVKSEEMMTLALNNGTHRFEWMHTKSNGELFPVEVLLTAISNEPNKKVIHCVWRDITERKKANEALHESVELTRSITQSAPNAIITINSDGFILSWNNTSEKLFGYSSSEMINKKFQKIIPVRYRDKHKKKLSLLYKGIEKLFGEPIQLQGLRKDGTEFPIELSLSSWSVGNKKCYTGIIRDITESKRTKEELIRAKDKAEESDRLKTEFLNNMSHEIRTPMNGILGFSEFLNDPNLDMEKRQNFVKIIQNSGNQLLRIIDDILEISTLETRQVVLNEEKCNLNDLLFELFSIFNLKSKENLISLYLEKGLSDNKSIILTDKLKLHKVLSNLLENALKFTNTGQINFGYQLNNNRIAFFVRDTGIGIPKGKVETIFERFSQADKELSKKVGGLGLGLSIAKENVMLLGGEICVESKMLEGSTFKFDIPFKPYDSDIDIDDKEKNNGNEETLTFLIAEDEEVNFMFIEILLLEKLKIDCQIIHAKNGQEAVEICKNNATIDLVLMDLKMPVMSGFEATRLIKEFRPELPIIAQTAYTSNEDRRKAKEAGCNDFISKPIRKETLNNRMKIFIDDKLLRFCRIC